MIKKEIILGAIAGDISGSAFEHKFDIPENFNLFNITSSYTDDTVLTIAVLECMINDDLLNIEHYLKSYTKRYPKSGFGPGFIKWVLKPNGEKGSSCGNGASMRISSLGALIDY